MTELDTEKNSLLFHGVHVDVISVVHKFELTLVISCKAPTLTAIGRHERVLNN